MKKILSLMLVSAMTVSMIACGNADVTETTESSVVSTETVSTETVSTETVSTETVENTTPVGEVALEAFKTFVEGNAEATAEEVANAILPALENYFGPAFMPVEEGLLTGFGNAEIKGFEEGAMFSPMIGTIPFVGYIFTLPADADADAFVTTLTDNANLAWNVCTEADQMLTEVAGNKVFFVMSSSVFE